MLGCLAFYGLLSVMATQAAVTLGAVVSVLGYCLLPMVVLSGINILVALQWVSKRFQSCIWPKRSCFQFANLKQNQNSTIWLSLQQKQFFLLISEVHSVSFSPACVFYGVQRQPLSYLWLHIRWTISRFWLHIHVRYSMVFSHWLQFSKNKCL